MSVLKGLPFLSGFWLFAPLACIIPLILYTFTMYFNLAILLRKSNARKTYFDNCNHTVKTSGLSRSLTAQNRDLIKDKRTVYYEVPVAFEVYQHDFDTKEIGRKSSFACVFAFCILYIGYVYNLIRITNNVSYSIIIFIVNNLTLVATIILITWSIVITLSQFIPEIPNMGDLELPMWIIIGIACSIPPFYKYIISHEQIGNLFNFKELPLVLISIISTVLIFMFFSRMQSDFKYTREGVIGTFNDISDENRLNWDKLKLSNKKGDESEVNIIDTTEVRSNSIYLLDFEKYKVEDRPNPDLATRMVHTDISEMSSRNTEIYEELLNLFNRISFGLVVIISLIFAAIATIIFTKDIPSSSIMFWVIFLCLSCIVIMFLLFVLIREYTKVMR